MKTRYIVPILIIAIFLAACEKPDLNYPVAVFKLETKPRAKYKFTLDASDSFSENEGNVLEYRWDLNGDHLEWETDWLTSPKLSTIFQNSSSVIIGLQVKNQAGNITELYRQIYAHSTSYDYYISTSFTDINPAFRTIRYSPEEYSEDYHYSIYWAYDNLVQANKEGVTNFNDSYTQNKYGSLISWDSAMSLNDYYKVPTLEQWNYMIDLCGGPELAGYNLPVEVEHGLNLPYSGMSVDGSLLEFEEKGYYWTGEEASESTAWAIMITKDKNEVEIIELDKSSQVSVRVMFENYQYFD